MSRGSGTTGHQGDARTDRRHGAQTELGPCPLWVCVHSPLVRAVLQ